MPPVKANVPSSRKLELQKRCVPEERGGFQDEEDATAEHQHHVTDIRHASAECFRGCVCGAGHHWSAFSQPDHAGSTGCNPPDNFGAPIHFRQEFKCSNHIRRIIHPFALEYIIQRDISSGGIHVDGSLAGQFIHQVRLAG